MTREILSLSSIPRAVSQIYVSLLRVQDRLKELMIIRGIIAVAVPTLSALIIPVYGIIGIGYVWLGVHVLAAIVLAPRLASQVSRLSRPKGGDWEDVNHF